MENLTVRSVRCQSCGLVRAEDVSEDRLLQLLQEVPSCPGCGLSHLVGGVLVNLQEKAPEGMTAAAVCTSCGFARVWAATQAELVEKLETNRPLCPRCVSPRAPRPGPGSSDPAVVLAEAKAVMAELDAEVSASVVEQVIDQLASQTGIVGALVLLEAAAGVLEESLRYGAHLSKLDTATADEVGRMARAKGRELAQAFNSMSEELRKKGIFIPPTSAMGGKC